MKPLTKSLYVLSTAIICFTIIFLPFYDTRNLFKSYITEKAFLLAGVAVVLLLLYALIILFDQEHFKKLRFTCLDLALLVFAAYLSLNRSLISEMDGITLKHFQLMILCLFYFIIRSMPSKYYQYFIYSLLLSGIIQAVYGNLQLYSIFSSRHHLFNITGSFFNPGPYAGYLSMIFPIALALYLRNAKQNKLYPESSHPNYPKQPQTIPNHPKPFQTTSDHPIRFQTILKQPETTLKQITTILKQHETRIKIQFQKYLSLAAVIAILLVIPATRSRASWLALIISAFYILIKIFPLKVILNRYLNTKFKKFLFYAGIILLFGTFISGVYYFKKDSADGRLLIWKISFKMMKDKPLLGHGHEKFQADYMDYQAAYFQEDPKNKESYVADDIMYPFNEYIKLGVESGLIGLSLLGIVLFVIFSSERKEEIDLSSLAVKSGILGLMIFAFFSYPTEILPVIMNLTFLLAFLAKEKEILMQKTLIPGLSAISRHAVLACLFFVASTVFVIGIYFPFKRLYQAYFLWDEGYKIYQMNAYDESLKSFEEAYDILKNNGEFLIMYGKALSIAGENKEAVNVLQKAKFYQKNTILYTAMGDSYKSLNEFKKAESSYKKAYYMIPGRFYPQYLLAKLYEENKLYEKAQMIAHQLMSKKEKIPSTAIDEIKAEMEKILKLEKSDLINPGQNESTKPEEVWRMGRDWFSE